MEPDKYEDLKNFIVSKKKPENLNENQLNWLRQKSKLYKVEENQLKYIKDGGNARIVLRQGEIRPVFEEVHASKFGGHPGINTTIKLISQRYYWPNLTNDVKAWVKECPKCQLSDPIRPPRVPELQPIHVDGPFEMVGVDLMGPFSETKDGYKYIFTCTDYFTKWVEAFPMKTKTSTETAKCLERVISRHGAFGAILTDQGREFVNKVNDHLCESWGINHKITAAYHPQTNGLDERTNQTIKQKLRKVVNEQQDDWDQFLDGALFSIRMAPQSSTKYSPFRLLYGREPRIPSELPSIPIEVAVTKPMPVEEDIDDFVSVSSYNRQQVEEKSKENVKKAKDKQKKEYRKRKGVGYCPFRVGDTVKLFNSKKKVKKGLVLQENYTGPYVITNIEGKRCHLKLKGSEKQLKQAHSMDNIKHYKSTKEQEVTSYVHGLEKTEELFSIINEIETLNLVKVQNITEFQSACDDQVFSLVREVSKHHEDTMDIVTELVLPMIKNRPQETTSQQAEKLTILSAVLTHSFYEKLSPLDIIQAMKGLPKFFPNITGPDQSLGEDEHILICGEGVRSEDLETLNCNNWLNDKIINAYIKLISREANDSNRLAIFVIPSYTACLWDNGVFDSHLFRKVQFANYKYIFVPWNVHGNHWVLMVADIAERCVGVLDSMGGNSVTLIDKFCQFMMMRGEITEPELGDCWMRTTFPCNKQSDGNSCGVFVLMNAECLAVEKTCKLVRQHHVEHFRKYVRSRLLRAGVKIGANVCDAFKCQRPRGPARWFQCDICHRWWHRRCMETPFLGKKEYLCPICTAQYS